MKSCRVLSLLLSSAFLPSIIVVDAHRPLTTRPSCSSDYGSSQMALPVPDPTISWSFKHYADCTHRALWTAFTNPYPSFQFYVGVGVPTADRFSDVRANALIIGPGLPSLSDAEFDSLPQEIRSDPVWRDVPNVGAYHHVGPEDQSTCNHLGTVMRASSTVRNGRCDFYEPFGGTHSWRVLDADNNNVPIVDETYHVAVYLQDHASAKFGVALGTWVEDFRTRFELDAPSCERDMSDFSEKDGSQEEYFPYLSCSAADGVVGGVPVDTTDQKPKEVCELGQVCPDDEVEACQVAETKYTPPSMGACGGERCPAAVNLWEKVNMDMHEGMMNMEYTGNADIDFARGMIPHHIGAVDMCHVLLNDLTCTDVSDVDNLDGLVHFCSHVEYEQEIEVGGLQKWLAEKGESENAPCPTTMSMTTTMQTRGANNAMMGDSVMTMMMPESCGMVNASSSAALIELNHKMMELMAVEYSCDHSADFVRQMIPHHAAAIEMCEIVLETTEDYYLVELCGNITLTQRAEVSWMYDWLKERELAPAAPCDDCDEDKFMKPPCEDLLSTSSFCHGLSFGQDGYCRCEDVIATDEFSCDSGKYLDGFGVFEPSALCKRTCGLCQPVIVDGEEVGGIEPSEANPGEVRGRKLMAEGGYDRPIWPHTCFDHHMGSSSMPHDDEQHGNQMGRMSSSGVCTQHGALASFLVLTCLFAIVL